MERESQIEKIRQRARANFRSGLNCAECVLEAIIGSVDTGLPVQVQKLATGFGGGIGLFGDTCGALTGAVMGVGAVFGRIHIRDINEKEYADKARAELYGRPGLYRLFNQIPNRIQERFGHTLCRELTVRWNGSWLCREHAIFCREIITFAAGVAAELILSDKDKIMSQSWGKNVEGLKD